MIERLEVIMAARDDATDAGVHVQHHHERNKEATHPAEHHVATVLIVAALLVTMPILVIPEGIECKLIFISSSLY